MIDLKNVLIFVGFVCFMYVIWFDYVENPTAEDLFMKFIDKYNRSYATNQTEYLLRFQAFKDSLETVDKLNSKRPTEHNALYGITEFSDLTSDEFKGIHLRTIATTIFSRPYINHNLEAYILSRKRSILSVLNKKHPILPDKVDWREKNVITDVYSQNLCGACWAFSTVETIEAMAAIKTNSKPSKLSVQKIVDCSENQGCDGGDICVTLSWLVENNITVPLDSDYPLRLKQETCQKRANETGYRVVDYTCENYLGREMTLLSVLANHGPVAVAVNALMWQHYLGGVIQYHCNGGDDDLNHAVQLVGYDLTGPIPYYIARNSWGTSFGNSGYLNIAVGDNVCGVAMEVGSVTVV